MNDGILSVEVMPQALREAHKAAEESRWSAISFLAGFALFLVLSGGLG